MDKPNHEIHGLDAQNRGSYTETEESNQLPAGAEAAVSKTRTGMDPIGGREQMVSRKTLPARLLRAGELLGSALTALGFALFLLNAFLCGNPGADPGERLDRPVPVTFGDQLLAADSGYLFCHNGTRPSLNVYDDRGQFVCAYRIPNRARGVSDLFSLQGDVVVRVYRGGGSYRYDSRGNYLGHRDDLDGADLQTPDGGNYRIRWTTLYRPDGTAMERAPLWMVLWTHPFAAWLLIPLGYALRRIFKARRLKGSP